MSWNIANEEGGVVAPSITPAIVDDPEDRLLSELEQVDKYLKSEIPLQRLVHVKKLADACRRAGIAETRRLALPLIPVIFADPEYLIRQAFADVVGQVCTFLRESDNESSSSDPSEARFGYNYICIQIMPLLSKLLIDPALEVRNSAGHALVALTKILDAPDMEHHVLTTVLCLAHDEHDEHRSTAVTLLHELAPSLGRDLCHSFLGHELVAMSEDPSFRVRKATASAFANVCQMVGPEYSVQRLLPAFLKLSKDAIWGVRKGCVDNMIGVANSMTPEVRINVFVPLFDQFTKDISRWVRNGAYEMFGPFLATLDNSIISPDLLKKFAQIPSLTNAVVDSEVSFCCAFNFPAVLLTVGESRWGELKDAFRILVKDTKFKVRKTLSHSLHEMAKILGPTQTALHLVPAFHTFLRDIDEVKTGVVSHFAAFLSCLPPASRSDFLEICWELQSESDQNWRLRKLLAQQVGELCESFPSDVIVRLAVSLLRDRVATVRQAMLSSVGQMFCYLLKAEADAAALVTSDTDVAPVAPVQPITMTDDMPNEGNAALEHHSQCAEAVHRWTQELVSLAHGKSYQERQLFARAAEVCWAGIGGYAIDEAAVRKYLLPLLLPLATDRVPNVRVSVARTLSSALTVHPAYYSTPEIRAACDALRADSDADAAFYFSAPIQHTWAEAHLHFEAEVLLEECEGDPSPLTHPSVPNVAASPLPTPPQSPRVFSQPRPTAGTPQPAWIKVAPIYLLDMPELDIDRDSAIDQPVVNVEAQAVEPVQQAVPMEVVETVRSVSPVSDVAPAQSIVEPTVELVQEPERIESVAPVAEVIADVASTAADAEMVDVEVPTPELVAEIEPAVEEMHVDSQSEAADAVLSDVSADVVEAAVEAAVVESVETAPVTESMPAAESTEIVAAAVDSVDLSLESTQSAEVAPEIVADSA